MKKIKTIFFRAFKTNVTAVGPLFDYSLLAVTGFEVQSVMYLHAPATMF